MGGPEYSDLHYTLHVSAGTLILILPFFLKADGDAFKHYLRLNPKKAFNRGDEGSEVTALVETSV